MKIWEALIYGLVAGLTGLLPVSFSGHAAVLQDAFALSPLTQGGGLYVRAAITLGLSAAGGAQAPRSAENAPGSRLHAAAPS